MSYKFLGKLRQFCAVVLSICMLVGTVAQADLTVYADTVIGSQQTYEFAGCSVTYKVNNSWNNYVTAEMTVTNTGETTMRGWGLTFNYDGTIDNIWNATKEQADGVCTITPMSYNCDINPGASVSFGFMAYGDGTTPDAPENLTVKGVQAPAREEETDTWQGLKYALFTSSPEQLSLYTNKTNITGNVHSNGNFYYQGNRLSVDGSLEAAGLIKTETNDGAEAVMVGDYREHATTLSMPPLTPLIVNRLKTDGDVYEESQNFNTGNVIVDNSMYINGSASFNTTSFLGRGIIHATDSITVNVGEMATGGSDRIFLSTENGDITLNGTDFAINAVLYAPNGCVRINAGSVTINGRIIAKSVEINATNLTINATDSDFDILKDVLAPEADITVSGELKENRRVIVDLTGLAGFDYVDESSVVWSFTKDGETVNELVGIDESVSGAYHKELIFKESGEYIISVTLSDGQTEYGFTETITIMPDLAPVAQGMADDEFYLRNEEGNAFINLTDTSYSPDGDTLGSRVWEIYHDADNNGEFVAEELVHTENSEALTYAAQSVGKYQARLIVTEYFDNTIPALLMPEDYLSDIMIVGFEVGNEKPEVSFDIKKAKRADIVFTVGGATVDDIETVAAKSEELKAALEAEGVDVAMTTVSSSSLTAKDTFAWKEYDHYNYDDAYLPILEKHIINDGQNITMMGYSTAPLKDFLYVEDDDPERKQFEFDMFRDETNWHTMEGGGFLFNTDIDEENNTIKGYAVIFGNTIMKLVQIDSDDLQGFRDGKYNNITQAGKLLIQKNVPSVYNERHYLISADKNSVSVWIDGINYLEEYILPEETGTYGYGPITSHGLHACSQQSYFTFSNITMSTIEGTLLGDAVENAVWREGAKHYLVHLGAGESAELKDDLNMAGFIESLLENEVAFVRIGNDSGKQQFTQIINAIEESGMLLSNDDVTSSINTLNQRIINDVLAMDYEIRNCISTDELVEYEITYSDPENDPVSEMQWTYEYDSTVFGEVTEDAEHITEVYDTPLTLFENTGAYTVSLSAKDDASGNNENLEDYNQWSNVSLYSKLLLVQTRPEGNVDVELTITHSPGYCMPTATYGAWDADHPSDEAGGIRKEEFYYKALGDSEWTEGKLTNKLWTRTPYLVKYKATDVENSVSKPIVEVVDTSEYRSNVEIVDTKAPEIYLLTTKDTYSVGETIVIDAYAEDENGVNEFYVTVNGRMVRNSAGYVNYIPDKAGEVVVKATARDLKTNISEKTITLYVYDSDVTPPTAELAVSENVNTDGGKVLQFIGTATDNSTVKNYVLEYRNTGSDAEYMQITSGTEAVDGEVLGELRVDSLDAGTYEARLTVTDKAGNTAYKVVTFEVKTTTSETKLSLTITIEGVAFNEDKTSLILTGDIETNDEVSGYEFVCRDSEGNDIEVTTNEKMQGMISTEGLEPGTYQVEFTVETVNGLKATATGVFEYQVTVTETGETVPVVNQDTTCPEIVDPQVKLSDDDLYVEVHGSVIDSGSVTYEVTYRKAEDKSYKKADISEAVASDSLMAKIPVTELETDNTYVIRITAKDESGNISYVDFTLEYSEEKIVIDTTVTTDVPQGSVTVTPETGSTPVNPDSTDKTAPTAEFLLPEADSVLKVPVNITGTVTDETALDYYTVEYRLKGNADYITFAEGEEPVTEGILGYFDTTVLANGIYEVRITAVDTSGNRIRTTRAYTVDGGYKPGAMFLGFTDATGYLGGATVNVNRYYSSTNKREGDFGYGWTLGLTGMTLHTANDLTEGYIMEQSGNYFNSHFEIQQTKCHDVIIDYANGESDRFELVVTPNESNVVPIYETNLEFNCVTNPDVELEFVTDTTAHVYVNQLMFYNEQMYADIEFKLTREDGTEVYFSELKGVTKIVTASGVTITVDENGYHADNKKSIKLTRDEEGRVTKVTDTYGRITTYTYDEAGNLASVKDPAGLVVSYVYDDNHNLVEIIDPMGIATARNEYDESGRVIAIIDAEGNRIEMDYDIDGKTQAVKDALGNITVYTYDNNGNIIKTVDAYGNVTETPYDSMNNILSITDALGNVTGYTYDESGNLTDLTYADGTNLHTEYDSNSFISTIALEDLQLLVMKYDDKGNITEYTDALSNVSTYEHSNENQIIGITDSIGKYMTATYDANGNMTSKTNGNGEVTSYTYDYRGKCTAITQKTADGKTYTLKYGYDTAGNKTFATDRTNGITRYTYDKNGNVLTMTNKLGGIFRYTYDDMGNMLTMAYPDSTKETFEYDANGNLIKAQSRTGLVTTYEYDKLNRMTAITYPEGTRESYTYDAVGNVTSHVSVTGAVTTYGYDSRNRNTSVTDSEGTTTIEYDNEHNPVKITDARGNATRYEYDGDNNIKKITYADGNSISITRDLRSRITAETDENGNITTYVYDNADRLIGITDALGGTYEYSYDILGNLTRVVDANGNVTVYECDGEGRVTTKQNAAGMFYTYEYNKAGDIISENDYSGTFTYNVYDNMSRLKSKKVDNVTTTYTYDVAGNLTQIKVGRDAIKYEYDQYDRLTKVTDVNGKTVSYAYDEFGRKTSVTTEYGTTTYGYDSFDRLTSVTDAKGRTYTYTYDAVGNRAGLTYPNGVNVAYTYDNCNRLVNQRTTDAEGNLIVSHSYELGKGGERLRETVVDSKGTRIVTYTYDALNRLVKEETDWNGETAVTIAYGYDAVSNRVSKETTITGSAEFLEEDVRTGKITYTYNELNQLVTEESAEGIITYEYDADGSIIATTGLKNAAYTYDSEERLIKAEVTDSETSEVLTESYTYDFAGNRASKTESDGSVTYYVNDVSEELTYVLAEYSEEDSSDAVTYVRGDELLLMERNEEVWYYIQDGHSNTEILLDEEANVTDRYVYDAYGNLLVREGSTENDFLYCGEQYNAMTGLYYLRARYMNPATGTFISEDAYAGRMNEPVTLHKYLYAHANPVKYVDPSGYMADTMAATYLYGELSVSEVELNILVSIWALLKLNDIIKSSEAARFADFYQSKAKSNPNNTGDDARKGDETSGKKEDDTKKEKTPDSNPEEFTKMKGNQGYKDKNGNTWKKDKLHKDHWDVSNKKGQKVKEVDFDGNKIWPDGVKNKNKR